MEIKIGILSDTHLQSLNKDFRELCDQVFAGVDVMMHAGDFVSAEIVRFLSLKNFHGVHGNMDSLEIKEILPKKKVIQLGPYRIGLIHGWGSSEGLEERIRSEFPTVDLIVYGHSHRAANHRKDGLLFFNPGTATGFTSSGHRSVGILELGDTIHGHVVSVP